MEQGEANAEVEGCYLLTGPPPFSVPKEKLDFSQPELLLCEILYYSLLYYSSLFIIFLYSIKHDLARSCVQLWPIINDEKCSIVQDKK